MTNLMMSSTYNTRKVGCANTLEYRLFLEEASTGKVVSPFHDIPVWINKEEGIVNMFGEIPRWTNAKLEVCKEEPMNPVKQDVKKGVLRFVKNVFPFHGYPWNYGAIPQTWESPDITDQATGCKGDNDPIDAVEIGSGIIPSGSVRAVKVLGVIGLIDEGETDWKIIVIDVSDPLSAQLHDIGDVRTHCPRLLEETHNWFRDYKVPDGKGLNTFAFNGEYRDRSFALSIINETHEMWRKLISGEVPNSKGISLANRLDDNPHKITKELEDKLPTKASAVSDPAVVDPSVHNQVHIR